MSGNEPERTCQEPGVARLDQELKQAGAQLRFRDEGKGPAVLLIHGWTLDLDMWDPQARALKRSFRILRFDRRGFGLSSGRPSLVADVADALTLCSALGVRRFAALGTSQGARVAAHVAAQAPERVSCLILDGVPSGILRDGAPVAGDIPMAHYRALARSAGRGELLSQWRRHPLMQLRTRDQRTHALLGRMLERYPALDLEEGAPARAATLPPLAAKHIRSPCLVISGAFDLASRIRAGNRLARALPGCERALVPEAGHMANLDNPQAYNTILRGFLRRFAS